MPVCQVSLFFYFLNLVTSVHPMMWCIVVTSIVLVIQQCILCVLLGCMLLAP